MTLKTRQTGIVKTIHRAKGFAFIRGKDNADYFMHRTAIDSDAWEALREGTVVSFVPMAGSGKGPRADNVQVIE